MKYLFLVVLVCSLLGCTKQDNMKFEVYKNDVLILEGDIHKPLNSSRYHFYVDNQAYRCTSNSLFLYESTPTMLDTKYICKIQKKFNNEWVEVL